MSPLQPHPEIKLPKSGGEATQAFLLAAIRNSERDLIMTAGTTCRDELIGSFEKELNPAQQAVLLAELLAWAGGAKPKPKNISRHPAALAWVCDHYTVYLDRLCPRLAQHTAILETIRLCAQEYGMPVPEKNFSDSAILNSWIMLPADVGEQMVGRNQRSAQGMQGVTFTQAHKAAMDLGFSEVAEIFCHWKKRGL